MLSASLPIGILKEDFRKVQPAFEGGIGLNIYR